MDGSSLIGRIEAHYKNGRECLEIPEWGENDEPLKVYCSPLTLAEKKKIEQWSQGDEYEGVCRCIIMKATDENGVALFDITHLKFLQNKADASVIERIMLWISSGIDIMKPESTNIGQAVKK